MATKQVMIGPQILHGADRFGEWVTEGIEGWDEAPAARSEESARVNSHGDFPAPAYYAARTPTIDGILFAKNRGQGLEAIKALNQAAQPGLDLLSITDYGKTQWARSRFAGLDYTWVKPSVLRWQLRLNCPDPYKYGSEVSKPTASGVPLGLSHRGNAPAWPVVKAEGSSPGGYEMSLNGRLVQVVVPLVSGKPHVINMRTGAITVDGVRTYGAYGFCELFSVEPGLAQNFYPLAIGGSATFTASFNDTYI